MHGWVEREREGGQEGEREGEREGGRERVRKRISLITHANYSNDKICIFQSYCIHVFISPQGTQIIIRCYNNSDMCKQT